MKKYLFIVIFLILSPVSAQAAVMGFMDGNFYDPEFSLEKPRYGCLQDGNCYDYFSKQETTLSKILGFDVPAKPLTVTIEESNTLIPNPTPTPVTVLPTPTPAQSPTPTPTPVSTSTPAIPTDTVSPVISYFSFGSGRSGSFQVSEAINLSSVKLYRGVWDLEKNMYVSGTEVIPMGVTYYKDTCSPSEITGNFCDLEHKAGKKYIQYGDLYYIGVSSTVPGGAVFMELEDLAGNKAVSIEGRIQ